MTNRIITGDCFEQLPQLDANSVHAIVTDPPYGLAFMGRSWDDFEPNEYQEWCEQWATECLRVLKPGGHLLAFSGNRTHHRLMTGIEDAGYEIRDTITWHYGSGFPKALAVSKAIDKQADAEREVIDEKDVGPDMTGGNYDNDNGERRIQEITEPATDAAEQWDGFKSALKPATEFVCVARAPLSEDTIAENVLMHGTGALNIDATRIDTDSASGFWPGGDDEISDKDLYGNSRTGGEQHTEGRYPSNVVFDEQQADVLDSNNETTISTGGVPDGDEIDGRVGDYQPSISDSTGGIGDEGGVSRYFKTVSWDGVAKVLNAESTKDQIDCQLCNHTLATSAEVHTKRTQAKQESSAPMSATSNQSVGQTDGQNTSANSAETHSKSTQTKTKSTAQKSATENQNESERQSNVDTAGKSSKQSRATTESTVQNPAHQKTSTGDTSKQTGTTTTSKENEKSSKNGITTTQSSEKRSKQERKQTENTLKASPVRSVELPAQIGTTTTTITLLTCVGCAEAATSNTTKKNTEGGAQDSPKRYKYASKASKSERTLEDKIDNTHPTVKPLDLMEWLVTLATAEGQTIVDPFCGSGTTCKAAKDTNRQFIGIEEQSQWADIARVRAGLTPDDHSHVRSDDAQQGFEQY